VNVFNRLLALLFFLLVAALAIGAIGIASGLLTIHSVDRVHMYPPLHHALSDFHTSHPEETRIWKVLASGAIGLLALVLVLLELTPKRKERELQLAENQDGDVAIRYSILQKIAERASMDVPGVQEAHCTVARAKDSLRVRCRVGIDRYANAEAVGTQTEAAIKQQLERTVGRPVEQVAVQVEPRPERAPIRVR
jgi:uncharacterized alkaline shock family protein YloU